MVHIPILSSIFNRLRPDREDFEREIEEDLFLHKLIASEIQRDQQLDEYEQEARRRTHKTIRIRRFSKGPGFESGRKRIRSFKGKKVVGILRYLPNGYRCSVCKKRIQGVAYTIGRYPVDPNCFKKFPEFEEPQKTEEPDSELEKLRAEKLSDLLKGGGTRWV